MEYYIVELPSGVRGVLKRVKSPVVHSAITIGAGSSDELSSEFGAAHFMEHMFFKGTTKRGQYRINSLLDNAGGELNAYTTKEETVIHSTVLKSDFRKGVDLMSDVLLNSTLKQSEIDKERVVIMDEINSYKDSPADQIFDNFEDIIFENTPLGHPILGNKASLKKIDSAALRNFTNRCYCSNRVVFSVIGNITPERFKSTLEHYFGTISTNISENRRSYTPSNKIQHIEKHISSHQCHLLMGTTAYNHTDCKHTTLGLLTNILGGQSPSSILNQELREKRGLTYNVEASYSSFDCTGLFSIYVSCDKEKQQQCSDLINKELYKICNTRISDYRLSRFKKQLIGQLAIASDNNENLMLSAARSLLIFGEIDSFAQIKARIESISSSEIMEVANQIVNKDNFSTLIYR